MKKECNFLYYLNLNYIFFFVGCLPNLILKIEKNYLQNIKGKITKKL